MIFAQVIEEMTRWLLIELNEICVTGGGYDGGEIGPNVVALVEFFQLKVLDFWCMSGDLGRCFYICLYIEYEVFIDL